jgi:hypothetical protein
MTGRPLLHALTVHRHQEVAAVACGDHATQVRCPHSVLPPAGVVRPNGAALDLPADHTVATAEAESLRVIVAWVPVGTMPTTTRYRIEMRHKGSSRMVSSLWCASRIHLAITVFARRVALTLSPAPNRVFDSHVDSHGGRTLADSVEPVDGRGRVTRARSASEPPRRDTFNPRVLGSNPSALTTITAQYDLNIVLQTVLRAFDIGFQPRRKHVVDRVPAGVSVDRCRLRDWVAEVPSSIVAFWCVQWLRLVGIPTRSALTCHNRAATASS